MKSSSGTAGYSGFLLLPVGDEDLVGASACSGCLPFLVAALLAAYHTQIEFATKHLGFMTVRGHFLEVALTSDIDPEHPEKSSAEVASQTASIHTGSEARDSDLRASNFLEADTYSVITFTSTSARQEGPDGYSLTGDLTIKETTRPVTIEVTRLGEINDPEMMGHRIAYSARTQIRRHDFGLAFDFIARRQAGGRRRDPDHDRRRTRRAEGCRGQQW